MVDAVNREFKRNPAAVEHFEIAFLKMFYFNVDCIHEDLLPLFSDSGRPSNQQPEIFRSFALMVHFQYSSLRKWLSYAKSSTVVSALVGVSPDNFPGESTHRDFISRLWAEDEPSKLKSFKRKPKTKLGNEKLPPKHPGIIKKLVDKALSGETFKRIPERLFQSVFTKVALFPSANMGLLGDTSKLIISADGTCVESNASPYCKKTCSCDTSCLCPRKFADPLAKWGWDSFHERWFYGHTAYLLSAHNKELKLDLPVYMKFAEAQRFDGVTFVTAIAHARHLYEGFLSFDSLLADSAHDNYPTYDLLTQWGIKPFIALNSRSPDTPELQNILTNKNGVPICPDGHEMANWGFESKKYRIKYRCPFVTGKVKHCSLNSCCNKTPYGKIVYVRLAEDIRLLTPVPRGSVQWAETYNQRTAAERVNNRVLTDYKLESPKRYGKKKLVFFAFINAINVHLDAQVKFNENIVIDKLIA